MNSCKCAIVALILSCTPFLAFAQSSNSGWIFLSHTQKLNSKWDVLFDAQVRTGDGFKLINTLLLRSALSYNVSKTNSVALGYASKNDWEQADSVNRFQPEHRIYQQYLFVTKFRKLEFTGRARYEQRFVRTDGAFLFSQRARAFVALQIPLSGAGEDEKGLYLNFQEEIFLNVFHKQRVNNSVFDQNRILGSLGYPFKGKVNVELGYMRWYQRELDGDMSTNILQLMVTTKF